MIWRWFSKKAVLGQPIAVDDTKAQICLVKRLFGAHLTRIWGAQEVCLVKRLFGVHLTRIWGTQEVAQKETQSAHENHCESNGYI